VGGHPANPHSPLVTIRNIPSGQAKTQIFIIPLTQSSKTKDFYTPLDQVSITFTNIHNNAEWQETS